MKAAKVFGIARATIYRWLNRQDLEATKVERRKRKLDWRADEVDVKLNPDAKLIDRAKKIGFHPTAIWYALEQMKITQKKRDSAIEKETEKKEYSIIEYCEN